MRKLPAFHAVIYLFLASFSSAGQKNYLKVGEDPVNPYLVHKSEKVFSIKKEMKLTVLSGSGKKSTGWLSTDYHLVGAFDSRKKFWKAVRIYECGNPILSPKNINLSVKMVRAKSRADESNRKLISWLNKSDCPCNFRDLATWSVGPGLLGYGLGAKSDGMTAGGGVVTGSGFVYNRKLNDDCKKKIRIKRGLIGVVFGVAGYLIGNSQRSDDKQISQPRKNPGAPGPPPSTGASATIRF
ncbi:hypothetical protein GW950_00230 [Candidatus Wolfebacteria bacterium]|nr:hypothetical protein [Candidatus Wolfebacteria bacterium]